MCNLNLISSLEAKMLLTQVAVIVPRIWQRFKLSFIICFLCIAMMVIFTTNAVPFEWQIPGYQWALIIPLSLVVGCHILLPVRQRFLFLFNVKRVMRYARCTLYTPVLLALWLCRDRLMIIFSCSSIVIRRN